MLNRDTIDEIYGKHPKSYAEEQLLPTENVR